jgi:hypothetical protein
MNVGWAYPTAGFVPGISLDPAPQEVRAFRVDVKDDSSTAAPGTTTPEENDRYVLSEITLRFGDWLCPQGKLAVDYGWLSSNGQPSREQSTHHVLLVRLYRSGYKTVEIPAWELAANPNWHPVSTLAEQEKAVDDLVSTFARDDQARRRVQATSDGTYTKWHGAPPRDSSVFARLAPGSASKDHRAALLFAASEYDLLSRARADDPDRAVAERATEKAAALRKLAGE